MAATTSTDTAVEHVDVLIVGAGISGIGAAFHLQRNLPRKSYAILEARAGSGGTWDLFRYPGIRSDSDLPTLGYAFKPWTGEKAIADGPAILDYVRETAHENGIEQHIRYGHKVVHASWSSEQARWTVDVARADTGDTVQLTCGWLLAATGYYSYDSPFVPEFQGRERFAGEIFHPQHWPEDLDYTGKRVVVIGSGATAVTLVPAMTDKAAHVTMLQRSPTYIIPVPSVDALANTLRRVLGDERGHALTRRKNVWLQKASYELSRRRPQLARRIIRRVQERMLPAGYDIDTHFTPKYDPWDERLCVIPDADLFKALHKGTASIVTDHIETFTETGILLRSGEVLEADIIITATGLNLQLFGGAGLSVDGEAVDVPEHVVYRGTMLSDVPNFSFIFGYVNASWTLRADLLCEYLCRVLAHMDATGTDVAIPVSDDPGMVRRPMLDFAAGYVQRSQHLFPKQGEGGPWEVVQSYAHETVTLRTGGIDDGILRFSPAPATAPGRRSSAVAA